MNDAIDKALRNDLLTPPDGFADQVMALLPARPIPARAHRAVWSESVIEWLALTGAVLAGMAQLIPFLFGIWTFASAG